MLRLQEIEFYNTPDCEVMIKPKGEPVRVLTETGIHIFLHLSFGHVLHKSMGGVKLSVF